MKTFDGERCVYGALTREIRSILLKEYNVITKRIIRRNEYDEFLRKAYENFDDSSSCDVQFVVQQKLFNAHRYILMIRCRYFWEKFVNKWRWRNVIQIKHKLVNPDAFDVLLRFLYTGIVEFPIKLHQDVLCVFKNCLLNEICETIQKRIRIQSSKSKQNQLITLDFPIYDDYYRLFRSTLPKKFFNNDCDDLVEISELQNLTSDLSFKLHQDLFRSHRLFWNIRSDYFAAMIRNHFGEANANNLFEINEDPDVFVLILEFIYTNQAQIALDQTLDILYKADEYLIFGLKKYCATLIGNQIEKFDPIEIIQIARFLNLPKLEAIATKFIAENLKMVKSDSILNFHK